MFIAAFVAGLAVQGFQEVGKHSVEFAEEWGQLLNLSVFFFFGMIATSIRRNFAAVRPLRRAEPDSCACCPSRSRSPARA